MPPPKSLEDYDLREFGPEDLKLSSFAYLVGLYRSLSVVFETLATPDRELQTSLCEEIDSCISAWMLLLPKQKRFIVHDDGKIDELLYQGHIVINTWVLSTLMY